MNNQEAIKYLRGSYTDIYEDCERECMEHNEVLDMAIEALEEQDKHRWIPITWHETTDEDGIDKEEYPFYLDCEMPDDGQDILVCGKYGEVWKDTAFNDDGWYLDGGYDFIDDVIAWMPLPEPYKKEAEE